MTKKEKVAKKKEEPRGLTLDSWNDDMKDNMDIVWSHRIKAEVIDEPATRRMTKPKMVDPMMNMMCYILTGKSLEELDD